MSSLFFRTICKTGFAKPVLQSVFVISFARISERKTASCGCVSRRDKEQGYGKELCGKLFRNYYD